MEFQAAVVASKGPTSIRRKIEGSKSAACGNGVGAEIWHTCEFQADAIAALAPRGVRSHVCE